MAIIVATVVMIVLVASRSPLSTPATPVETQCPGHEQPERGEEAHQGGRSGAVPGDDHGDRGHHGRADECREHAVEQDVAEHLCPVGHIEHDHDPPDGSRSSALIDGDADTEKADGDPRRDGTKRVAWDGITCGDADERGGGDDAGRQQQETHGTSGCSGRSRHHLAGGEFDHGDGQQSPGKEGDQRCDHGGEDARIERVGDQEHDQGNAS